MRGADRLHDRQAQAGAAGGGIIGIARTRSSLIDAEEALEHVRQRLRRNADAGVAHFQDADAGPLLAAQRDAAAARRELDGIVEQVDDHLLEPPAIAAHHSGRSPEASSCTPRSSATRRICSTVLAASSPRSTSSHSRCASPASRRDSTSRPETRRSRRATSSSVLPMRSRSSGGQSPRAHDLLQLALDDGQRRAQLVRGIGEEAARGLHRLAQPAEHVIE